MEKKRTMKAMVLEAFNTPLVLKELPVPTPAANEVLIRLMADGVCYTDVKIQKGLIPTAKLPLVMGHEIAGIVEEVGSEVKELKVGDKVAAFTYDVCGECHYCRRGIPALCENVRGMAGCTRNGGYEEYMTWPESALVKIPEGIPFEIAAVTTDAVTTCYHALCERVSVKEGDTVLIMGVGGLGINAVQIAKALGATVIAAARNEKKLEMAKNCGADYVFSTTAVNLPEECRKLTGGRGVDISADFAGNKAATELAFACLAPGGVQVQPGYSPGEKFEVDYMHFLVGERTLVASRAATKKSLEGALKLVAEGKVKPQIDSSAIMPLERVNEILDRLKAGDIIGRGVIKYY